MYIFINHTNVIFINPYIIFQTNPIYTCRHTHKYIDTDTWVQTQKEFHLVYRRVFWGF